MDYFLNNPTGANQQKEQQKHKQKIWGLGKDLFGFPVGQKNKKGGSNLFG